MAHTELESRLFREYWDDGLLDVFAGAGIVGIGICWAVGLVAIGAVLPAVLLPFWGPLRRSVVEPRLGLVEFSDERTGRVRRLGVTSVWVGVATFVALTSVYLLTPPEPGLMARMLAPGLPAFLLGLLAAMTGLGLGLPRFVAYAALLAGCGVVVVLVGAEPEAAMIGGGILIALSGVRMLRRLLQLDVEGGATS